MNKIVLVGMSGVGKSYYGEKIARLNFLPFFDIDSIIIKEYGKIENIFSELGEKAFRDIESKILERVLSIDYGIISTGGGIIEREENRRLLKKENVVFLYSSVPYLEKNIINDQSKRPMLDKENLHFSIDKLYKKRLPLYNEIATISVNVEDRSEEEVVSDIALIKNIL